MTNKTNKITDVVNEQIQSIQPVGLVELTTEELGEVAGSHWVIVTKCRRRSRAAVSRPIWVE